MDMIFHPIFLFPHLPDNWGDVGIVHNAPLLHGGAFTWDEFLMLAMALAVLILIATTSMWRITPNRSTKIEKPDKASIFTEETGADADRQKEPILVVDEVSHRYGSHWVLKRVSLQGYGGRCLVLMGPNGAGKTTLLNSLAGVLKPTSGKIKVGGTTYTRDPIQFRQQVGLIAHKRMLYPHLTALENLIFFGQMYNVPNCQERAELLLEQMGLWEKRGELVNHLSEGQGQRVSIARALMPNPPLILLDEPHSGLDISASRYLDRLLRELLAQNHALILTTHDAAHGLDLAQEMAILKKGEIVYQSDIHHTNRQELVEIYSQIFEPGGLKV